MSAPLLTAYLINSSHQSKMHNLVFSKTQSQQHVVAVMVWYLTNLSLRYEYSYVTHLSHYVDNMHCIIFNVQQTCSVTCFSMLSQNSESLLTQAEPLPTRFVLRHPRHSSHEVFRRIGTLFYASGVILRDTSNQRYFFFS